MVEKKRDSVADLLALQEKMNRLFEDTLLPEPASGEGEGADPPSADVLESAGLENMKESDRDLGFQVLDRRFWALDEDLLRDAPELERKYPTFVEELKARTELAERKLAEKLESLDRENEAFRSRFRKEAERRAEQLQIDTLQGLLEVVDNLERALEAARNDVGVDALREGVRLSVALFLSQLRSAGVEPLELVGHPFDPNQAEAVGTAPVDDAAKDQAVVEVVQKGYRWRDRLLRPARVRVGVFEEE